MDLFCKKCKKIVKALIIKGIFGGNKAICSVCGEEDNIRVIENIKAIKGR